MKMNSVEHKKYEDDFVHALLSTNKSMAREILGKLAQKESLVHIGDNFITPALERIGKDWENGFTPLSQVYLSSHICNDILDDMLVNDKPPKKIQPNIAIATLGDFHTLGKKIISYALRMEGYRINDFGYGLLIHDIVKRCVENKTQILLVSTLMQTSARLVKQLMEALTDAGLTTKVIVGGGPFSLDRELWMEVGAHAMGNNASDAIGIIKRFEKEIHR